MPDQKQTEEKQDEIKPGAPSQTDEYNIKRDRVKSIRQVVAESRQRMEKAQKDAQASVNDQPRAGVEAEKAEKPEPSQETKPETTEDKPAPKTPEKDTKAAEELAAKAAKEAAEKVAAETKQAFSDEIAKILDKDKTMQEKQQEADELIAAWDKENRLPKDYKELINETMRIADLKMERKYQEIERQKAEAAKQAQAEKEAAEKAAKDAEQQRLEQYQKEIITDLQDIYEAKLLPKPTNIDEINNPNTTDPAAKETQKVLEFGVKLNTERAEKGLPPVTSLNKIFFLYYQPTQKTTEATQPAGVDAPVAKPTAQSAPVNQGEDINYAEIHNSSWGQLRARAIARAKKAQALLK